VRRLYNVLIGLAVPLAFAAVLLRGLRDRAYRQGLGERFGFGRRAAGAPCIWLHAASLGEVAAAAAVLSALRARHPETPIVVTTATPTGRSRARELFGAGTVVRFLPYDTPRAVARFLDNVEPALAIIMETELWPNLFRECARRALPLVLASARLSAKSASRYRRCGALFRDIFTANVIVAAQTAGDAERFRSIGAHPERTHVVGNVKFDIEVGADGGVRAQRLRSQTLGGRPTWIAGSTHAGEDEQVIDAHCQVRAQRPDALLVLAPRHPSRFDGVAALLARSGLAFSRRSGGAPVAADAAVLLLDTLGELSDFYAAADIAFVGGSLVPIGGHNLLEPAALGVPVLYGPSQFNGRESAALLSAAGAALPVADARTLAASVRRLFDRPEERQRIGAIGRATVASARGSVARLLALIETSAPASTAQ